MHGDKFGLAPCALGDLSRGILPELQDHFVDIISGVSPTAVIYDESKMRSHLVECLQQGDLFPFPKVKTKRQSKKLMDNYFLYDDNDVIVI